MLTSQDWLIIKNELKKNIYPVFSKAGVSFSIPFDDIIDIFTGVLNKKDTSISDDIAGRSDIEELLKIRFIEKDLNKIGIVLSGLSTKLEGYIRKVYKISNQQLIGNGKQMLAHHLKTLFQSFHQNGHPDFNNFTQNYISDFFNENSANYSNLVHFKNAHKLGDHFKTYYSSRNDEGHAFPDLDDETIMSYTKSIIISYIYITYLYSQKLKTSVIHKPDTATTSDWNIFKKHCGNFEKNQTYFLITDKLNTSPEKMAYFTNIKWDIVFDLDTESDINGLRSVFSAENFPQAITQITHTSDDRNIITTTFPSNTTFWYEVQGNKSRPKSRPTNTENFSDWRTMYGHYTTKLMIKYYEKIYSFIHNPIKVIVLSTNSRKLEVLLYAIKDMNQNLRIDFIFANENNSELSQLASDNSGKIINLPFFTLLEGLREIENIMFSASTSNKIHLPCHSSKGNSIQLSSDDIQSVKQFFQIIHLDISTEINEEISDKSFYQGRIINWKELDLRFDVDRNITKDIYKEIRTSLDSRVESEIFYLMHYPGSGGTTIARRIAYDLHRDFPVLFFNETITSYTENDLVEKLLKIFQATELPCLVVVDNSNITTQQVETLERIAGNRLAKTVFFVIQSTFYDPKQGEKIFYLPSTLEKKNELIRFVTKFSEKNKEKESEFLRISKEKSINYITPFYFGLIAYEHEYISIDKYVIKRLESISDDEKNLLLLLAFCQIFAKGKLREIPHFIISGFLNINEDYIRQKKHTQNVKVNDLVIETDNLHWRIIHPAIASCILKTLIGTNDTNVLVPSTLRDFAISLIKSLRKISNNKNEQVLELLHNLFILRDEQRDIPETEEIDTDFSNNMYNKNLFSSFINGLEYNENRIDIFNILTSEFPTENAHFWAHFSRLHSINKDHQQALIAIDKALTISNDFIFYHIKGMCYRTELYRLKDQYFDKKEDSKYFITQMQYLFDKAAESFELARKHSPLNEHGYIAFIQMVTQIIEFEYSVSTCKNDNKDYTKFIVTNSRCRNLLIKATETISEYEENNPEYQNPKIKEKQISLLKYFGKKEEMINSWQSLLDKKEHDKNLVRRQLVNAYLAKNGFNWDNIKGKEVKRILDLTEENLKNKIDTRDLKLWFEASRILNFDSTLQVKKITEWEFKKPSFYTAYLLMCLYGIQAITGIKSGLDNYVKYKKIIFGRLENKNYSKVFCIEWVGMNINTPLLINNRQVGKWNKGKHFFDSTPTKLTRLKGKVTKYLDRNKGFIEIENIGIEVMYQPGRFDHFSDNAQKQTKVDFYLGFNYDGARAFEVKNR